MKFVGYRRPDGRVGTRNYVGVLSTVVCANEVARGIAGQVKGAVAFNHQQGCCQTSPDLMRVTQTLCGLGQNPNLAAVILVSLGCEGTDVAQVAKSVADCGKPVHVIAIQEEGGAAKSTAKGILVAQQMAVAASRIQRVECALQRHSPRTQMRQLGHHQRIGGQPGFGNSRGAVGGRGRLGHHGRSDRVHRRRDPPGPPVQGRNHRTGGPAAGGAHGATGQGDGR